MHRIRTYLAAPLFNDRERSFNEELATKLERYCKVFLPQRDGLLLAELLREGVPLEVAETQIFERDRSALLECDLLVAVLDGAHIDEGVAFELGFANARGANCIGLQTDVRRALPSGNNPMIGRSLGATFNRMNDLIQYVAEETHGLGTAAVNEHWPIGPDLPVLHQ
ncbi:MAG: nucleoside 2-deoxyribosyltransferase [Janthinobacterium lividum]